MDVPQRFQELRAFDGDLHCNIRPIQHVLEMPGICRGNWLPFKPAKPAFGGA
jgi:hypothetical protein